MEQPKKICSLGILDIILNLELTQKEAFKYNFNYNLCNSINDLEVFFEEIINSKNNQSNFELLDRISLSSHNHLINTLLFINRAYKNKTFIEFIMPNQLQFNENKKNIFNIFKYILDKNYFFIIENKINDIPSSIKFNIKIYKDKLKSKDVLYIKEFQLFEKYNIKNKINETDNIENENELPLNYINRQNILSEINYNFSVSDFFILDLNLLNDPVWKIESCNKDNNDINFKNCINLGPFLMYIINQNKNIKIITIISQNVFEDEKFINKIKMYKEVIEISDVIFSNKENINYFFQAYNEIFNDFFSLNYYYDMNKYSNSLHGYNVNYSKDLILYDKDKYRKNIPRTSILFNNFDYISIYVQSGINMDLDYIEIFFINLPEKKYNQNEFNTSNNFYVFIGGFLSRFIYNKSFKICSSAGQLLLHKIIKSNITNFSNIDDYNITVPNKKKINILQLSDIKKKSLKNKTEYSFILNNENRNLKDGLNNWKRFGFIEKSNIYIKEGNSQRPINYRNKSNKFKTMNNINLNNKNNSMTNIFEKYRMKKRLLNNNRLPKIQRNSSSNSIIMNEKNRKNNKIYNNLSMKNIQNKSKNNYCHERLNREYIFRNNNHYKLSNSLKFPFN